MSSKAIAFNSGLAVFTDETRRGGLIFRTSNEKLMAEIEESASFGREIELISTEGEAKKVVHKDIKEEKETLVDSFEHITTFSAARAVLSSKPYNIPTGQLKNSTAVREKISELGLEFPNLPE